jgi:3-methyl-2-oxobutanoate hydroxymethyltransferase
MDKVNILTLKRYKKENIKASWVSCYDYPSSVIANRTGIDVILVGDSAEMNFGGAKNTLGMTMEEILYHVDAVIRGNERCYVVGDMVFQSFHESNEQAIRNAERFLIHGCSSIKLEGFFPERAKAIVDAEIDVFAHLGLTPMSKARFGNIYKVQGKTKKDADKILEQSLRMQDAGCVGILFEGMPSETTKYIADQLDIITIGIGAGPHTDAQLCIINDLIGMCWNVKPRFAKQYCDAANVIAQALSEFNTEIKQGLFPAKQHCYDMKDEEVEKLLNAKWKYEAV